MTVVYIILPLALVIAIGGLVAFIWAARSGQFDDLDTPSMRLLHDDEPAVGRLVRDSLAGGGYVVDVAPDGATGLAMAQETAYTLLLVNSRLPDTDGLDVLRQLSDRGPLPPTIMVTGLGDEAAAVEAMHLGADAYVAKDAHGRYLELLPRLAERVLRQRGQAKGTPLGTDTPFHTLASVVSEVVFRTDASGKPVFVNDRWTEFTGIPPQKLPGDDWLNTLHEDDRTRVWEEWTRAVQAGRNFEAEYRVNHTDGRLSWVRAKAAPEKDSSGAIIGFVGTISDITKRKETEEALGRTADSLAKAEEVAHLGNWEWDLLTDAVYRSDEMLRIYGVSRQELAATPDGLMSLVHPDDRARVEQLLEKGRAERVPYTIDFRLVRPNGELRWVHAQGTPILDAQGEAVRIVGMLQDLTALKQAEAERALHYAALDHAAEMIVITNAEGGIEYVNPAFERTTGYAREEALGCTPRIVKSGRHDRPFYEAMWQTIKSGDVWRGHFANRRKDGTLYEEDAIISPVRDADGRIVRFIKTTRDVTRERKLEAQLRQSQKMEAVGTLAGGIAHDFNNILTALLGYAELAQVRLREGSEEAAYLGEVLTAGERARALVNQILTFSRQQESERRPIALAPLIEEVQALMRAGLPSTIEIFTDLSVEDDIVLADPTEIHQVLMNLCTNAGHAMPDGGALRISLANVELDATFGQDFPELRPGPYVRLTITDTGTGMSPDTLSRIFEPYFTTKGDRRGTGLGLAVVHGIAMAMGGEVTVTSELGGGTTFHVYLPRAGSGSMPSSAATSEEAPRGGTEAILLVDDEPQIRALQEATLSEYGYAITVATTAADALQFIHTDPGRYDLLVTDLTMPGMTGVELAAEVRKARQDMPILLCTGFKTNAAEAAANQAGVTETLTKPVRPHDLARTVRRLLDNGAASGEASASL